MTDSTEYVRRSTMDRQEISLSDLNAGKLHDMDDPKKLSTIVLLWEPDGYKTRRTDIGSYCFSERSGSGRWVSVNPRSLISHDLLPKVVKGALLLLSEEPNPTTTVALSYLARILGADKKSELRSARDVYQRLNLLLRTVSENPEKALGGLVNLDKAAIAVLCHGFDAGRESLVQGIGTLRYFRQPPAENRAFSRKAGKAVARSAAEHFLALTTALLENEPLPFSIEINQKKYLVTASTSITTGLPRYLRLDDNGHPPPDSIYGTDLKLRKLPCPRYGYGRPDDDVRRMKNKYGLAVNERLRLEAANKEKSSTTRRRLIAEALLSFCIYTYFDTGANISTLQGQVRKGRQSNAILVSDIVDEDDKVILTRERGAKGYLLTTEKPRAGNKKIPVVFSSFWVKRILPKYLLLREHLSKLGCSIPTTLIFSLLNPSRSGYQVEPNPRISSRLMSNCGHLLNLILQENGLTRLSIRMIRNYKSAALTREHGIEGSAKLMGHKIETSARHYNQVEEAEAQLQISKGINRLIEIAIVSADESVAQRLPGGGACTRDDSSAEVDVTTEALGLHAPNCKTRTGCWLCPHFAIHADKEDLWKMKSYLFVIDELRANSMDRRGVDAVHDPIVKRLIGLCDRVIAYSEDLAEAEKGIDNLISDGGLHPLYRSLLDTYEMVNLI